MGLKHEGTKYIPELKKTNQTKAENPTNKPQNHKPQAKLQEMSKNKLQKCH